VPHAYDYVLVGVLGPEDSRLLEMLLYFNIQVTSFVENPTPHECVGLHGFKLYLQSALGTSNAV